MERKEFQVLLESSLQAFPERLAMVFILREVDGLGGGEICEILGISPGNFWVMLHRARLHLRESVDRRWFRDLSD